MSNTTNSDQETSSSDPRDSSSAEVVNVPEKDGNDSEQDSPTKLRARWIGVVVGMLILGTALTLSFLASCVSSALGHTLAAAIALGAALILWGFIGGFKIDTKLRFPALGEVTAGGAVAVFVAVHLVSAKGIVAEVCQTPDIDGGGDEGGGEGEGGGGGEDEHPTSDLHGRVVDANDNDRPITGATVLVEYGDTVKRTTTDLSGQFSLTVERASGDAYVMALRENYVDTEAWRVTLPVEGELEIPMAAEELPTDGPNELVRPTTVEEPSTDGPTECDCPGPTTTPPGPPVRTLIERDEGVGPNAWKAENETMSYGGSCRPGHELASCGADKHHGHGTCSVIDEDENKCLCRVKFTAPKRESVRCNVTIYQRKKAVTIAAPECRCS